MKNLTQLVNGIPKRINDIKKVIGLGLAGAVLYGAVSCATMTQAQKTALLGRGLVVLGSTNIPGETVKGEKFAKDLMITSGTVITNQARMQHDLEVAGAGKNQIVINNSPPNYQNQYRNQNQNYNPPNSLEKNHLNNLEKQCLFDNCYVFWDYTPKADELNFSVSNAEIESPKYIPTKIGNEVDVTNLAITMVRGKESSGFSVDITDKDLRFKFPEIKVKGISYVVLKTVDNSENEGALPFYLIPRIEGTRVIIPDESFISKDYEIQAKIICNENGGLYRPLLKMGNYRDANTNVNSLENKRESNDNSTPKGFFMYKKWVDFNNNGQANRDEFIGLNEPVHDIRNLDFLIFSFYSGGDKSYDGQDLNLKIYNMEDGKIYNYFNEKYGGGNSIQDFICESKYFIKSGKYKAVLNTSNHKTFSLDFEVIK